MFLDDQAIEIIAGAMGFKESEAEFFKANYFETIASYMISAIVGYMAEHDPEKSEKINQLFLSDKNETKEKAHQTLIDQMKLYMASYEDLQQEIQQVLREYDNTMFFKFVGDGPKDDVLALLEYLGKKIDRMDNYQQAIKMAKKRFSENEVDEFFAKGEKQNNNEASQARKEEE